MSLNVPRVALVDTGYWFALLDERDEHHVSAAALETTLMRIRYLVPWPVMYETLCTRLARRPLAIRKFDLILKRPNAIFLNDIAYRDSALEITFNPGTAHPSGISMVDAVLRLALADPANRIDSMLTFNRRDFQDLCARRQIEML